MISISPEFTQAECHESEKSHTGEIQVSVAANETVGTCEGQTVMIIHDGTHLQEGEVVSTLETLQVNSPKKEQVGGSAKLFVSKSSAQLPFLP